MLDKGSLNTTTQDRERPSLPRPWRAASAPTWDSHAISMTTSIDFKELEASTPNSSMADGKKEKSAGESKGLASWDHRSPSKLSGNLAQLNERSKQSCGAE